ncbi:MAG: hypothetical protein QOJ99_3270 [Bryobacterales bacterium]|nr:hypothetical protein [Bryobacterales bacterium]
MERIPGDRVTLAYEDSNQNLPPIILVHGCGCDHSSLAPQAEFLVLRSVSSLSICVDMEKATLLIRTTRWLSSPTIWHGFASNLT